MSEKTMLKALERMGYKGRMTGHGFRGLASTALKEMGFRPDVIAAQLAWKKTASKQPRPLQRRATRADAAVGPTSRMPCASPPM
jgi:hypothetical protein